MRDKLTPKIILEGTRLTRKTDLAFALNEHPRIVGPRRYRYHSPLVSAEWCGFTPLPWGRGLVNFAPNVLPDPSASPGHTLEWIRNTSGGQPTGGGSCTLVCHGYTHDAKTY